MNIRQVLKSLQWTMISRILSSFVSIGILLYTGSRFDVNGVGLYGTFMVIGKFLEILIDYGFSQYGIVWLINDNGTGVKHKITTWVQILLEQKIIFTIILIPLFLLANLIVFKNVSYKSLFVLLYFILLGFESSFAAILESQKKFPIVSISWLLSSISIFIIFIVDLIIPFVSDVYILFFCLSLATFIQLIYLFIYIYRNYYLHGIKSDKYAIFERLKSGFSYFFFFFIGVSYSNVDKLVLISIVDMQTLGQFYFASRIATLFEMVGSILGRSIFPYVCESYIESINILKSKSKVIFLFLSISAIFLTVAYNYLVNNYFLQFKNSKSIFYILIIAYTFRNISYLFGAVLSSKSELQRKKLKINIYLLVSGIIGTVVFAYYFNVIGVAIATLIINILLVTFYWIEVNIHGRYLSVN